ncbi:phage integrase:Chain length determinant protein [Methylocaldum marinum]|uniref:Phage integrase:Chain length determinant protein n=1 Tax=Methylocaldum marinum TaxID=1432792 RepID=A0A250L124_9GAMM|nr:integrase [Methylocaldum marinum]BBA35759.1 phage integrase:Chain length determinant protein [Methylocaldum marinum]
MSDLPSIEILASPLSTRDISGYAGGDLPSKTPRRFAVFAATFLLAFVASVAYVWLRPPIYESTASLLTVTPLAIDETEVKTSVQHAVAQNEILLGIPLLEATLENLRNADNASELASLTIADLLTSVSVEPIAETNIVKLHARGSNPTILASVVNAWIEAYQARRERSILETKNDTSAALRLEFEQLAQKIEAKRLKLHQFRRDHGIVSKNDADNRAMAQLTGLNTALNKAVEDEVKTKAQLDAIKEAIARGEPVVPSSDEQGLANLERRAHDLRQQLKDLKRRYTAQYISLQPQLKLIPEQLKQTEDEIKKKLEYGKQNALSEAQQAFASAQQTVREIRRQIEAHEREASEFTTRFAEHEAMRANLEKLEEIYRDTEIRLAQVEAKPYEKLPQLQVIERGNPPIKPIWPNYWRDSGIAFGGSLALALVTVWLYEYLTQRQAPSNATFLPDIHLHSLPQNILLQQRMSTPPPLPGEQFPALESPIMRDLTEQEIRVLLEAATLEARLAIALLLSGLSLEEIAELSAEQIDLDGDSLRIDGRNPRTVPLAKRLKLWLAETKEFPDLKIDDTTSLIACAAIDSGLARPETIDAPALRHTYISYLVRQGIRLSELECIVGPVPAKTLAGYGRFSPPGPGLPADGVPLTYPALSS